MVILAKCYNCCNSGNIFWLGWVSNPLLTHFKWAWIDLVVLIFHHFKIKLNKSIPHM